MADFPLAVNPPQGVSYAAPLLNFTPLSQLADRYAQGVKTRSELDTIDQLKAGLPTTADGQIDYAKAAQMLAQTGNLDAVTSLAKIDALRQKADTSANLTSDIKEYQFAKSQGFQGTLADWMARKRGGAGEYGLQPVWGRDENGNPVMLQAGKSGEAIRTKLPEGVSLSGKNAEKLDAGTHWVLIDPLTRQQVGIIPKNIEGKEAAEERGKAQGQAEVALPTAIASAQLALKTIEQIRQHPGRSQVTGWMASVPFAGGGLPGSEGRGFVNLVNQAKGQTFLQAYQSLRGGGAITEVEGQKAEQAIGRLDRAQSDKDFDAALSDLEQVIRQGLINARKKAAGKFTEEGGGKSPTKSAAPAASPDPLAEARAAIAKGAPRDKVIERLKANGIDPTGL